MAEVKVSLNRMSENCEEYGRLISELANLESELEDVVSSLHLETSDAPRLRSRIRSQKSNVDDQRSKLSELSRKLGDIIREYMKAEQNAANINAANSEIKRRIDELSEKLSNTERQLGLTPGSTYRGDPVNMCNGNYIYNKMFLQSDTPLDLSFRLFYNIQDANNGSVGRGWTHTYEKKLVEYEDRISIRLDDASELIFIKEGDSYYSLNGTIGKLSRTEGGYVLTRPLANTERYGNDGRLLRIENLMGEWMSLEYDERGQLIAVEDLYHNTLKFTYNDDGYLQKVEDYAGRKVLLSYEHDRLVSIVDEEGAEIHYQYDDKGYMSAVIDSENVQIIANRYDEQGRTLTQLFPDGGVIQYAYDDEKNQIQMTEQNGNRVSFEHDTLDRNVRNIYENGEELFTFDENNRRTSYVDRRGNRSEYEYDDNGDLIRFRNALSDELTFSYTDSHQLLSVSMNGRVINRASFNENHLQEWVEDALGQRQSYEYDENNHPVVWVMADGTRRELEYDESGNMISISGLMGGKTVYQYDELHRVTSVTTPNGNKTCYTYGKRNEVLSVVNANGDTREYDYDSRGNLAVIKDFDGGVTRISYNFMNKPEVITDADGNETHFEYDRMWNVTKRISADGAVRIFEYDSLHRLVSITDENGFAERAEYDANGNLVTRTDRNGNIYRLEYDALNRVNKVCDPLGHERKAEFDASGNVTKVIDADGLFESYEYDAAGRLVSETNRSGYRREYEYNALGRIICVKDSEGILKENEYYPGGLLKREHVHGGSDRTYFYDADENLIKICGAEGVVWNFAYDCLDRVISAEDNGGFRETYEYDARGNVCSVTDGEGVKWRYTYSKIGLLTSVLDGEGNETRYGYDKCRRLTDIFQPEAGHFDENCRLGAFADREKIRITHYERDAAGNIVGILNPLGNRISYSYDACGNLLSKTETDGTRSDCTYNPDGTVSQYLFADGKKINYRYNALKQLVEVEDWQGITRMDVDAMGRPEHVVSPDGQSVFYEWGFRGERRSMTYPDGQIVSYGYDEYTRLVSMDAGNQGINYKYDAFGRLREKLYSEGYDTVYSYGESGKIKELDHREHGRILTGLRYDYDGKGRKSRICRISDERELRDSFSYEYNGVGSLECVTENSGNVERYEYDAFGNRISSSVYGHHAEYRYNRLDQLVSMKDAMGEHQFIYDARGNQIEELLNGKQEKTLEYDVRNLLTSIECGNQREEYQYNGFGYRIGKRLYESGLLKRQEKYSFDITKDSQNLLSLMNGEEQTDCFWDNGPAFSVKNGSAYFYLNDERSTPIRMLSDGKVSEEIRYDSFGCRISGPSELLFGFTGYQNGQLGGLRFSNTRSYDPDKGRFLSIDPFPGIITLPLTFNAYSYCMGDPVNYYDPTGAIWAWLAGGIVGAAVNVVTKFAGDVVNSVVKGEWSGSSWQEYVGTAVGGFAQGSVFAATGQVALAGAAGSAAENFVTNGLNMATGVEGYRKEDGYGWGDLLGSTATSAATGAVTGFAFNKLDVGKYIKIPGITSGRGSYMAVFKRLMTMSANHQIKNMTMKSLYKGLVVYGGVMFGEQLIKKAIDKIKESGKESIEDVLSELMNGLYESETNTSLAYWGTSVNADACRAAG